MKIVPAKLVTCVVAHGRGRVLIEGLRRDLGIVSASMHHARGVGRTTPTWRSATGEAAERDVLRAVVSPERADKVFEYLYFEGGLSEPHAGFIHLRSLTRSVEFTLPDLPGAESD